MRKIHTTTFFILLFFLCVTPSLAQANIGIPMMVVFALPLLYSFAFVVLIEAFVTKRYLNIPHKIALKTSFIANLVSTFIGIPITWVLLVAIQAITGGGTPHGIKTLWEKFLAVTWQAAWLVPYESDLKWMVPTAGLVLLIPFFFASWKIENYIAAKILKKNIKKEAVNTAIFRANLVSYILFALCIIGWGVYLHFNY